MTGLLRTFARYGAGARWLNERYPGISPRWPLSRQFAARLARRRPRRRPWRAEEAAFRAIDALGLIAHNVGYTQQQPQRAAPERRAAGSA